MLPRTLILALAALSLSQAGCGGDDPAPTTLATPAAAATPSNALTAGSELPAPKGKVVLRIAGVEGGAVALDLKTLDRMPRIEATVHEPFLKRDVDFAGVRFQDLLEIAGAPSGAGTAKLGALDDYHVDLAVDEMIASEAMLATRADGKRIDIPDGGPIRIVFLGDTKMATNTDNWIWSVSTLRLTGE